MRTKIFISIAFKICMPFLLGIIFSFAPEWLNEFFGDHWVTEVNYLGKEEKVWHWGARHYWYAWMVGFLFFFSLINLFVGIYNVLNKEYPKLFNGL